MEIRESQIEDILVSAPILTKNILALDDEPRLLIRQMIVPSGRLDLLYAYRTNLLLVELKVVPFHKRFVKQILDYKQDLIDYQNNGKLLQGEILPYLICTEIPAVQRKLSSENGVYCKNYNPAELLHFFYENFKPIASLSDIKPFDIGIWNLHLINKFIYHLEKVNRVSALYKIVGGSSKTLYNKIKFAWELRLINWLPNKDNISLSKFGKEYIERKDKVFPDILSETQAELLRKFVIKNPYESSIILGIASVVESVFALAKNTYPILMSQLMKYFSYYAGKYYD